ncbi:MAG: DUF4167 domain-containing protein [Aliishimia sp.]
MKSSRSRSRNKNNRNNNRPQGGSVINRVFDSSGPEGKVRGTPQQIIDKYNQLARDAQLSNDRVAAENFQQHAEHYLRLLSEAQREMDTRREEQERQNRERQAERDRERTERQDREPAAQQPQQPPAQQPEVAPAPAPVTATDPNVPGSGDQPDIIEPVASAPEDSNLVETPEEKPKPKPKPRARKPRKPKVEAAPETDTPPETPKAAE